VRWAGARRAGPFGLFLRVGVPALLVIGGLVYLLQAADSVKPERHETRIELPHALDN
jgi:hypothetical protein